MNSILSQIKILASQNPDAKIIYTKSQEIKRKEFIEIITCCTNYLINKKGIKPGNKVILFANNSLEFISIYFSIHAAGAICIPLDPISAKNQFKYINQLINANLIIKDLENFFSAALLEDSKNLPLINSDKADITFTSGTTGEPKGVLHSHAQQVMISNQISKNVCNKDNDTEIIIMPLCHSFALGRMRSCLSIGTPIVLGYPLKKVSSFFKAIEKYRISGFGIVPSGWEYLMRISGKKISNYKSQIRYIELGSAVFSIQQKQKIREMLPHTKIVMHYGLTEISRALFTDFSKDPDNAVGNLSGDTSVRIIDENAKIVVNDLKKGEIALKSPWMIKKYYKNSKLTQNKFIDGYFLTGDLGYIDGNYLILSGRVKEMINIGGKKISPLDVEEVLNKIPGILESVCVATHDDISGEAIKACLVIQKEYKFNEENVNNFIKKFLPNYMIPKEYQFIKSIPKTPTGKIKRLKLTEKS